MKKILVTTDLSIKSKSALRFAIQLAAQSNVALTFLHVQHVLRMTTWNDATYRTYEKNELAHAHQALVQFVDTVYKRLTINPTDHTWVVENSPLVESTISRSCLRFYLHQRAGGRLPSRSSKRFECLTG